MKRCNILNKIFFNIGTIFFFCSFFLSTILVYKKNEDAYLIDIPHIEIGILPVYIILVLLILSLCFLYIKKYVKLDYIAIMLLIRLIVHCVSMLYLEPGKHFDINFITSMICFFSYVIAMNLSNDATMTFKVFAFLFVLICIQAIFESILGKNSFFDSLYLYKHDLTIPIGSSNGIVIKVLPMFIYLITIEKSKRKKYFFYFLFLFTLVLTKSRSGIICSVLVISFHILWTKGYSKKTLIYSVFFIIMFGLVVYVFLKGTNVGHVIFSSDTGSYNSRIQLWKNGIELFSSHPIFGNGFSVFTDDYNPHNFIIHILCRSGVAGIILFFSILFIFFKKIKPFSSDYIVRASVLFCFAILFQGLVENVLFNYMEDLLLWYCLGTLSARIINLKKRRYVKND